MSIITEIFTGNKAEQRAVATERRLKNKIGKDQTLTPIEENQLSQAKGLTRRLFFKRLGGETLAVSGLVSAALQLINTLDYKPQRTETHVFDISRDSFGYWLLVPYAVSAIRVKVKEPKPVEKSTEDYDPEYAEYLLSFLESGRRGQSVDDNLTAVVRNLSLVESSTIHHLATALRIDESGYFLTAARSFFKHNEANGSPSKPLELLDSEPQIYHPASGMVNAVRLLLVNPNDDLVLCFAPTGKPRKFDENMQLTSKFEAGIRLWSTGLVLTDKEYKEIIILSGISQGSVVEGMKPPIKSLLGGPVFNHHGAILGFLKSAQNESGSPIIPIEAAKKANEQVRIY